MDNLDQFVLTNKKHLKAELQKLSGTKQMWVSPEIAEKWLEVNQINRPISETTVQQYVKRMQNREWCLNGEPIIFSSTGVLLDGQHRLVAVINYGAPVEFDVRFGIDPHVFHTLNSGKTRTFSDSLALQNVPNYSNTAAAIRLVFELKEEISSSFNNATKPSSTTMLKWYKDNPEIQEYVSLGMKWYSLSDHILPASEFAGYVFVMAQHDKKRALTFMDRLATGTNITTNSPIYHLRRKLFQAMMDNRKNMKKKFKRALIIKAWNAYAEGRSMKLLRYSPENEEFPTFTNQRIPLLGTV